MVEYQRLVMKLNDKRNFAWAFECYICHRPFHNDKVCEHEHLTGKHRGAGHERCNLMLRKTYKVPHFLYFRGSDSSLIGLGLRSFHGLDITLIGHGMQKYLTAGIG